SMCSRRRDARSSWSMPSTSRRCRGTNPTSRRVSGWPTRHAPWGAACQLCPAPTDPGVARSHAVSQAPRLVELRTQQINRIHQVLETANLKRGAVASKVVGVSGRRMLRAVAHGESDAAVLADLAKGRLREKLPALQQALAGRVHPHQRLLVGEVLDPITYL